MTQFLLTNDDGIEAPGLETLEQVAAQLGAYAVVAPLVGHSGCSHLTTTSWPLRVAERGPQRKAVDGTPADCVRLGLLELCRDAEWVLSGINAGGNLGADVYLSGTVAAAREAAFWGKPSIAISHYRRRDIDYDWPRVVPWVAQVVKALVARGCEPRTFYNVNVPHVAHDAPAPQVVECFTDFQPMALSFRYDDGAWHYESKYHDRPRTPGSDVEACFSGHIAVSVIRL